MKYITIILVLTASIGQSQNTIENILTEIIKNNKSIRSNQQFWEAKKLLYKTGLNPSNPKIEYEYLVGSSSAAGNQTDFYIVQAFDFPTSYSKKNQVAKSQIVQSGFKSAAYRQNILLKAKQYCIELVYLNKINEELIKRVNSVEKINFIYQKKLTQGDASILDANKAKLQLLNLKNELRLNASKIKQHQKKIIELNGGTTISFSKISYPISPILPKFETLEKNIEENDPDLKSIHQQNEIDKKKIALSKAMSLPKLEGGYRSQAISGQKLQGIHLGITIPLWENKNKVKHQKAHLLFNSLQVEEHHNEHHYEIQQLYEQYKNLNIAMEEYQKVMPNANNVNLLTKALNLGEISSITYFVETNYFYNSYSNYLSLEKDYHQVIAELYKYKL